MRKCWWEVRLNPKRRETPSSWHWFLTGKKAKGHPVLQAWLAGISHAHPPLDLSDGGDRLKFVTDDELPTLAGGPSSSLLVPAAIAPDPSLTVSQRAPAESNNGPATQRDLTATISRYYNDISGWGGVSVHDGLSLTFRMVTERTLRSDLPIAALSVRAGAIANDSRTSSTATILGPNFGSQVERNVSCAGSCDCGVAEAAVPLYFEVLMSVISYREFSVSYNPYHPNGGFPHNLPVPASISHAVHNVNSNSVAPHENPAAPPRTTSSFSIPASLPPAYISHQPTPHHSRASSPAPSRPLSGEWSGMVTVNELLLLEGLQPISGTHPSTSSAVPQTSSSSAASEAQILSIHPPPPPRGITAPRPVGSPSPVAEQTRRPSSPLRGPDGRPNVPVGHYLVSPPVPPPDEHPIVSIGLVSRPYPSFLLAGRYPTSVAYVLDVNPINESQNKASIVLCCEDTVQGRVVSRRWELGREWTAREGDTVGVGVLPDKDGFAGCVYFTVNGRQIEMGSSVRLKHKGWERINRHFRRGPDSAVLMEAGGDEKLGSNKLFIRVPELAGGLGSLYPAVGTRGAAQLLANTKGPHLFADRSRITGQDGHDCPPTYEEVVGS